MSHYWSTERRTTLPGTSSVDAEAKHPTPSARTVPFNDDVSFFDSDSSDDEHERPGAFAVQVVNDEEEFASQEPDWDPTEPQDFDEGIEEDASTHLANVSTQSGDETNHDQKKKNRPCLLPFLAVLILGGVIVALVVLLLPGDKDTSASSGGEETPPSVDRCEIFNPNDPFVQCELCSQPVRFSGAVQDTYNSLKAFKGLAEYLDSDMQIESCTPANLALVWLASEVTDVVTQDRFYTKYESVPSRFLLAFLYFAWNGGQWKGNKNWLSTNSECDWFGVDCNEQGKIESLSLPQNNMTGSLESRLGLLRDIKILSLDYNNINGSIPLQLWNLSLLEKLGLSHNHISGTLPASLGENTTALTELSVHKNSLVGPLPSLSGLTNLKILSLTSNNFDGTIPNNWGDLTQLTYLGVWDTYVSGTIPESIGKMTSLTRVLLRGSSMYGSIPTSVGYLTDLVELFLDDLGLVGSIPSELGLCTQLEILRLPINNLTGSLPTELGNLSMLKLLEVQNNMLISGTVPVEYANLANLTYFGIFNTQIEGPIPSGLCHDEGEVPLSISTSRILCDCCSTDF